MKVSVILPTYNEADNIIQLVREVIRNVPPEWKYEVILIDDNSPDETYRVAKDAFKDNPFVIILLRTSDRGLANSIRCGIEMAQGGQVLVMDTDFTHDPKEIPNLLHVGKMYDIVSGSRFSSGGNMQSRRHYLASFVYNLFIRVVLRTQIQDNLGGFFTIKKRKLDSLPKEMIFFGYGDYYFRLLHYAQKRGMSIVEVPVIYRSRKAGASKSDFGKLLFSYTRAVLQLRLRTWLDGKERVS